MVDDYDFPTSCLFRLFLAVFKLKGLITDDDIDIVMDQGLLIIEEIPPSPERDALHDHYTKFHNFLKNAPKPSS